MWPVPLQRTPQVSVLIMYYSFIPRLRSRFVNLEFENHFGLFSTYRDQFILRHDATMLEMCIFSCSSNEVRFCVALKYSHSVASPCELTLIIIIQSWLERLWCHLFYHNNDNVVFFGNSRYFFRDKRYLRSFSVQLKTQGVWFSGISVYAWKSNKQTFSFLKIRIVSSRLDVFFHRCQWGLKKYMKNQLLINNIP